MPLKIIYRQNSEHDTQVNSYLRDFRTRTGKDIELVNVDTPEGTELARLYDIVSYPCVIAVAHDGSILNKWQDESLPLIDELSYYG